MGKGMDSVQQKLLDNLVVISDFPKDGVRYLDFYRTFDHNQSVRQEVIDVFKRRYQASEIDAVVGIATGGLTLASALAYALKLPLIPIRKAGDTVYGAVSEKVGMVYADRELTLAEDAFKGGETVLLVDDTIATGGTFNGAIALLNKFNVNVHEISTVFETLSKNGRAAVSPVPVYSLISQDEF